MRFRKLKFETTKILEYGSRCVTTSLLSLCSSPSSSLTHISYCVFLARLIPHGPQPPTTCHSSLPKSTLHLTRPHPCHDPPLSSLPRSLHPLGLRAQHHPPYSETRQHRPRGGVAFGSDEGCGLGLCGGVVLFGEGEWAEGHEGEGEGVFELCVGVG